MKHATPSDLPAVIDKHWKVGIVASTYHGEIIDRLAEGARSFLIDAGLPPENITTYHAPGSFELPLIGAVLAQEKKADALIGFGIIVQGDTHHARLLAEAVTHGMMEIQVRHAIPFAFEVLYVDTIEQAIERSEGEFNKGREAARAVVHSLAQIARIRV